MDCFERLGNETIVGLISKAQFQVIYAGPAIDKNIANHIVQFARRTSINQVAAILDLDAEVYREGYGEPAALDILEKDNIRIKDEPGLRIGILIIDDNGWIFTPKSKIIYESINSQQKNSVFQKLQNSVLSGYAIVPIGQGQISMLLTEEDDSMLEAAVAAEESISKQKIDQLKKDLKEKPAPDFEFHRLLSDYRNLIKFVEITFKGARLEQTTIKIPSDLLNVTKKKEFEEKMKATYQLFNKDFSEFTKPLKDQVEELRTKYTQGLSKKYGRVLLVKQQEEFEKDIQSITSKIEQYKQDLGKQIDQQIQRTKNELINYFAPVLMQNPPEQLRQENNIPLEDSEVKRYIAWLLEKEFPGSEQIIKRVEFHSVYKGVTEEILKDEQFLHELKKAFKDEYIKWPDEIQKQEEFYF
ncbi:hypothetical protein RCG23_03415 [Neobacillus sp. PS3-34]|uniref:hypothetical protein n=1 Tax=Neobacillus sp. PS3-34 TaxID=3070678 RepID=UPI0027DFCE22|nr:hypothetical protein [Neobacillus sp. PS3-34]WML49154.1 hypothetical protein RCG23_03415 [Neobacillus sp. PS3-34]